jgi:hypothetical protein
MKRTYVKPTTKTVRLLVQQFFAASNEKTQWVMDPDDDGNGDDIGSGTGKDPDADSRSILGRGMWDNM